MSELMLINPGRSGKKRKKKRHVKRAMSALQKKYFGKKSQRTLVMAKKKRRKTRRVATVTVKANPHRHYRLKARRRNPIASRRRRRHNPGLSLRGFNLNSFLKGTLMPSAVGAAGALGVNIVLSYLPIPVNLKTGPVGSLVKIAGAIGVGMVAGMVTNRRIGEQVTAGAVTVQLYRLMTEMLVTASPVFAAKAGLAGMDDVGLYLSGDEYPSMGYAGAGQTVDGYVQSGEYDNQRVSML